jgi:hypothetical protein
VKLVEAEGYRPSGLSERVAEVFARYAAIEAFARAVQREVTPEATGPKARVALQRAIEALRAAGMTTYQAKYLLDKMAQTAPKGKP